MDERAEVVEGDLRNVGAFARTLYGCRYAVHCAALYTFAPRASNDIAAVNVEADDGDGVADVEDDQEPT